MYTIISATHRSGSNTELVARLYRQILQDQGLEAQMLSLTDLPHDFVFTDTFGVRSKRFQQIIDEFLTPAHKFIIIAPEYNGGVPGILSAFLDAATPDPFRAKKVALVGVSTGRGGNVRGIEYFGNCLRYLGVHVYSRIVPLSQVLSLIDKDGNPQGDYILKTLKAQAQGFIAY